MKQSALLQLQEGIELASSATNESCEISSDCAPEPTAQLNKIWGQFLVTTQSLTRGSGCWGFRIAVAEDFQLKTSVFLPTSCHILQKVLIAFDSRYTVAITCHHLAWKSTLLPFFKPNPATVHLSQHSSSLKHPCFRPDKQPSTQTYIYSVRKGRGEEARKGGRGGD